MLRGQRHDIPCCILFLVVSRYVVQEWAPPTLPMVMMAACWSRCDACLMATSAYLYPVPTQGPLPCALCPGNLWVITLFRAALWGCPPVPVNMGGYYSRCYDHEIWESFSTPLPNDRISYFTFSFRAFSRRFYPKRLTISPLVFRKRNNNISLWVQWGCS
jgi:hypothetical protein